MLKSKECLWILGGCILTWPGYIAALRRWDRRIQWQCPTFEREYSKRRIVRCAPYHTMSTIAGVFCSISIGAALLNLMCNMLSLTLPPILALFILFAEMVFGLVPFIIAPVAFIAERRMKKWKKIVGNRARLTKVEFLQVMRQMNGKP